MQDAVALAEACLEGSDDIEAALARFERRRRPVAERLQASALRSIEWYESVEERLHLAPIQLTYEYMMRTGKISHDRLAEMDSDFMRSYEDFATARLTETR
jgi:2-polyprenyl-6-methoxyphenol hydroxylase-like FAD-dependent oxidoreductase